MTVNATGEEIVKSDEQRVQKTPPPNLAQLEAYERTLLRWMRLGLLTPGVAGVVLCACGVIAFFADVDLRTHEAVLIAMLGTGGLLILGAAAVATWRPEGFATYLKMHSELVERAATDERR